MPVQRILIADDDVDALRLVGLMLERKGYEIIAAASGNQALQKAIETQPTLIILDVMMPDIDGYDVATQLRKHPATEEIPILMFTAKSAVTDKIAGFQAGVDDYLTKPIHPTELTSRVEALLNRTHRGRDASKPTKEKSGKVIAFLPSKGGIGNSTLAINTAVELKQMHPESRIVIAELLSGRGTLCLQMNMTGVKGLSSLLSQPLSSLTQELLRRNINTHPTGLDLLCCTSKPAGFGPAVSKEYVRTILRYLSDDYDYVLIDLPATLTEPFAEALNLSQSVILALEPSPFGIILADKMLGCLDLVNVSLHKVHLALIHRSPIAGSIGRAVVEQKLQRNMICALPNVPELAFESAEKATPITLLPESDIFTQQIRRVVQTIVEDE
ncbi:MAG: response regulator [Anaerolineae bacterium]|nr:response regulator [Anaerolineae bacterium]